MTIRQRVRKRPVLVNIDKIAIFSDVNGANWSRKPVGLLKGNASWPALVLERVLMFDRSAPVRPAFGGEMAQRKIATPSESSDREASAGADAPKVRNAHGQDEDFVSVEYQRKHRVGPDYDPKYFDKLDALIEENYGPLGEFRSVNG